ncbi:hypothetical protein Tco_1369895 [Tanacetum coccineum]
MLCYLTRMEPYYIQCIKDGPFKPKIVECANKPESQWTLDERRVVNQDQCLKSIIISCLPDDIMESIIICKTTKSTWTDLVYSFEGPTNTKEDRIMDLKLSKLNPLDFQENSDDEADERSSEEYLRDLGLPNMLKDEEEVSDDKEMTQVKVLMLLADDELFVGKNYARNGEWIDITMKKVNILLSMDEDSDWQTYLKYINIDLNQAVNECLQLTEAPTDPKSSKESGSDPQTPLASLKNLQGASPSSERVARPSLLFLPSENRLLWHRYAVSSLMDTAYRLSKQYLEISSFKLKNACLLAYLHQLLQNCCK